MPTNQRDEFISDCVAIGTYGVIKSQFPQFEKLKTKIQRLIDKNKPVPASDLKKFLGIFIDLKQLKEDRQLKSYQSEYDRVYKMATEYFSKYDTFQFSGYNSSTLRVSPEEEEIETLNVYAFDLMLSYCIAGCLVRHITGKHSNSELFEYVYDLIYGYRQMYLNAKEKKTLTKYKIKIVAYYLLICLKRVQAPAEKEKINNTYISSKLSTYMRKRKKQPKKITKTSAKKHKGSGLA